MRILRGLLTAGLVLLLTGCRVELYRALPEEDANQMLATLMLHHIDADKQVAEGGITLRVEQSQFINAVELLRLNGFPRRQYTTADQLFPANQLVVSPQEEQQKIMFLKEQRVEGMLSQMDGVVHADVTIASQPSVGEGNDSPSSVAVFIKYSPQVNLEAFRVQIKGLIEKSIPGLQYGQISILLQPTEFRMSAAGPAASASLMPTRLVNQKGRAIQWLIEHHQILTISLTVLLLCLLVLQLSRWLKQRH